MISECYIRDMLHVQPFTFNPFSENTYLVYNDSKEAIIFDPGLYNSYDEQELLEYIEQNGIKPKYLINTHCHIDHIFGNTFVSEKFSLDLHAHQLESNILKMGKASASMYGLHYRESVDIKVPIDEKDTIVLGRDQLKILFTPGHSPGSLSFYSEEAGFVIAGDVLFRESIGRTDLPGGDYNTLIHSIRTELFVLPENTVVYSGHGPETDIAHEKIHNPFLNGMH